MKRIRISVPALVALVSLAACGGGNVIGPDNQLQVTNAADNFQWQASNLSNVTQTLSYTWQNSGTLAHVDNSSSITGGTATLTITDAGSTQVYSGSLASASTDTGAGTAGSWKIEVKLSGVTGTLNFRVQKKP